MRERCEVEERREACAVRAVRKGMSVDDLSGCEVEGLIWVRRSL